MAENVKISRNGGKRWKNGRRQFGSQGAGLRKNHEGIAVINSNPPVHRVFLPAPAKGNLNVISRGIFGALFAEISERAPHLAGKGPGRVTAHQFINARALVYVKRQPLVP